RQIRAASFALASAPSGLETRRSAKTLPLLSIAFGRLVFCFISASLFLLGYEPFLVVLDRCFQPLSNQDEFVWRRLHSLLGFLPETVQNIDNAREFHCIHDPEGISMVVVNDFQNPGASKSLKRLRIDMFVTYLRLPQAEPHLVLNAFGK